MPVGKLDIKMHPTQNIKSYKLPVCIIFSTKNITINDLSLVENISGIF